jgi:hypothetical protein
MKRPAIFAAIALVAFVIEHVLLRAMAHGHVAHVLLASGGSRGDTVLAVALLVSRLVKYVLAPGLVLAAAAEIVAYLLVGPKRTQDAEPF